MFVRQKYASVKQGLLLRLPRLIQQQSCSAIPCLCSHRVPTAIRAQRPPHGQNHCQEPGGLLTLLPSLAAEMSPSKGETHQAARASFLSLRRVQLAAHSPVVSPHSSSSSQASAATSCS